ncbi:hypothetical protein LRS71_17770 [Rhodococcus pyridinivorans]|uniref:hypothetical protein n=1 Tax=Rhodococcus pyridinivorans TaxID=103816 RepID=UPI001E32627B|nr:hypothetical protein [Rhodococcus pyridinivorans]MCD5421384.1 hypothetical protein [Rhodococcus pyridinivorans]
MNAIRTYMNNYTLTGWVKAETLMHDTGLKERAVREQISRNVAAGWLEIIERGNSSGRANTYRLAYPQNHAVQRRVDDEPCSTLQGNHAADCTPTTPGTSRQEKFLGTTPEENHAADCMLPDPPGSGVLDHPASGATTESDHARDCRVPEGPPERTTDSDLTPEERLLVEIRAEGSVGAKSDLSTLMGINTREVNVIVRRMIADGLIIHDADREYPVLILA